jgi:hypothetical protein
MNNLPLFIGTFGRNNTPLATLQRLERALPGCHPGNLVISQGKLIVVSGFNLSFGFLRLSSPFEISFLKGLQV